MGREVKRVPIDWEWPLNKVWEGYVDEDKQVPCPNGCVDGDEWHRETGCTVCWGIGYAATEPPTGDAWQMWETTSEGSPISPPLETAEQLAGWLANTNASTFGSMTATYEQWLNMITGDAWAPSAVIVNGSMMSGVEAVAS